MASKISRRTGKGRYHERFQVALVDADAVCHRALVATTTQDGIYVLVSYSTACRPVMSTVDLVAGGLDGSKFPLPLKHHDLFLVRLQKDASPTCVTCVAYESPFDGP